MFARTAASAARLCACVCACLFAPVGADTPESSGPPNASGLQGVLGTFSARALKPGQFVIGGNGAWLDGTSRIQGASLSEGSGSVAVTQAANTTLEPFLAVGLGLGFDLGLSLPLHYESLTGSFEPSGAWGMGDFSAVLKARLPVQLQYASFAVLATGGFPTSSNAGVLPARLAYHPASSKLPDPDAKPFGMDEPRAGAGLAATLDLSNFEGPSVALHFNLIGERTLAAASHNPFGTLNGSIGLEFYVASWLRGEAEFRRSVLISDFSQLINPTGSSTVFGLGAGLITPLGLTLRGGAWIAPSAWNSYLPLAINTPNGPASLSYREYPTVSGYAQVAWQGYPIERDRDHDGIPDSRDKCPDEPEDIDGFQDADGCPDPDNDGDGIPDKLDKCPYAAEDHDGFQDADGCPDPDNDNDGIPDAQDKCPNEPEDKDGFQDADGCPDPDNDGDGIPDKIDKCPNDPENFNGIEDADGCPELDSDGDGIPDARDKCPHEKETINFYQDADGCPDEKPDPIRDDVLGGVAFQPDGAELLQSSYLVLDGLAARLAAYPGTDIEIQAFVDDKTPGPKALTQARAEAVVEYLANRGIEKRRMKPVGYGSAQPIVSNRTAKGRETNRRVQIHRLN